MPAARGDVTAYRGILDELAQIDVHGLTQWSLCLISHVVSVGDAIACLLLVCYWKFPREVDWKPFLLQQ